MIEIIQAGQSGKTESLIEMHRVRKFIFKDRMGWDVDISNDELEIDNYDLPETVYILARDEKKRISGVWRMLPSTSPSMIRDLWPEFLEDFHLPQDYFSWEVSRFGVHSYEKNRRSNILNFNDITAKLITGLVTVCNIANIKNIYTMYNPQVGRAVSRTGFVASEVSKEFPVDGKASIVGRFQTDARMLKDVNQKTGIDFNISFKDLPPQFSQTILKHTNPKLNEGVTHA